MNFSFFALLLTVSLLVNFQTSSAYSDFPQEPLPPNPLLGTSSVYASDRDGQPLPNPTDFGLYGQGVSVADYEPKWIHLTHGGNDTLTNQIVITGCGFRTHTSVVCVFEFKTTSVSAWIVDDNTIICIIPERTLDDFFTLPQYHRLDLVFDGEFYLEHNGASAFSQSDFQNYIYVGQFRWGPEIDCNSPISPAAGYTDGSDTVSIFGEGFNDQIFNSSDITLQVFFDNDLASNIRLVSDFQIDCNPPPVTELYESRMIKIVWVSAGSKVEAFLVSSQLYFYGPEFDSLTPACSNWDGGSEMIISGRRFNDPLLAVGSTGANGQRNDSPRVVVKINGFNPPPAGGSGLGPDSAAYPAQELEAFGSINAEGTTITFLSPDFTVGYNFTSRTAIQIRALRLALSQASATVVDVRFSSNWRYSLSQKFDVGQALGTFTYGSVLDVTAASTYAGGGEYCQPGCFTLDDRTDWGLVNAAFFYGTNQPLCVGLATFTENLICCQTVALGCTITNGISFGVNASVTSNSNPYVPPNALASGAITSGPVFLNSKDHRTTVTGGNVPLRGSYLTYTSSSTPSWTNQHVISTSSASLHINNLVGSINASSNLPIGDNHDSFRVTSISSSQIDVAIGTASFGSQLQINSLSFQPPVAGPICTIPLTQVVKFGPTCSLVNDRLPLNNADIIISGEYLSGYSPILRVCDAYKPGNTQFPSSPSLPIDPITLKERNRCKSTNVTQIGTISYLTSTFEPFQAATQSILSSSGAPNLVFNMGPFSSPAFPQGRRLWGQRFDTALIFNTFVDEEYSQSLSFAPRFWTSQANQGDDFSYFFPTCADRPPVSTIIDRALPILPGQTNCTSFASLDCGRFSLGPQVTSLDPCQGPSGRKDIFTPTQVTLSGTNLNDNWPVTGQGHNLVSFGTLFQTATQPGSLSVSTVWGGYSHAQIPYAVSAFFETCNITYSKDIVVTWGPVITVLEGPAFSSAPGNDTDIYGFFPIPQDGKNAYLNNIQNNLILPNALRLNGFGFFYGKNYVNKKSPYDATTVLNDQELSVEVASGIRVTVDGVPSEIIYARLSNSSSTATPNDYATAASSITINVPPRRWGTVAEVCIQFDQSTCATVSYGEDYVGEDAAPDVWAYFNNASNLNYISKEIESVDPAHPPLCYSQKIHFGVKITGKTAGSTTSGYTSDLSTIQTVGSDIDCVGCGHLAGYQSLSSAKLVPYFGGYPSSSTINIPLTNSFASSLFKVPENRGEFNSDVPISFHLETGLSFPNNNCTYRAWEEFRISTEVTHHYGPKCSAPAGSFRLGGWPSTFSTPTSNQDFLTTLSGSYLSDCYALTSGCVGSDDSTTKCDRPINANLLQYPWTSSDNSAYGQRFCIHREIQVEAFVGNDWASTSVSLNGTLGRPITIQPDTIDGTQWDTPASVLAFTTSGFTSSNSDSSISIFAPGFSSFECRDLKYRIWFKDALISSDRDSQVRYVECSGTSTVGPRVTSVTSAIQTDGIIYGWDAKTGFYGARSITVEDFKLTFSGTGLDDPALFQNTSSYRPDIAGSPCLRQTLGTPTAHSATTFSAEVPVFTGTQALNAPLRDINMNYYLKSSSTPILSCVQTNIGKFHYGPQIVSSSRDGCTLPVCYDTDPTTPTVAPASSTVDILVRGLQCCGFDTTTTSHACYFADSVFGTSLTSPSTTTKLWRKETYEPLLITPLANPSLGSDQHNVRCRIPNPGYRNAILLPNQRIAGFGLIFGTTLPSTDICNKTIASVGTDVCVMNNDRVNTAFNTPYQNGRSIPLDYNNPANSEGAFWSKRSFASQSDSNTMDICFGFKQKAETFYARYSGLTRNTATGIDEQAQIPVQAECTTSFSTWGNQYNCFYDNSPIWINNILDTDSAVSSTSVSCDVPLFKHNCAPDKKADKLSVTLFHNYSSTTNFQPYEQSQYITSTVSAPQIVSESGQKVTSDVLYGPSVHFSVSDTLALTNSTFPGAVLPYKSVGGVDYFIGYPAAFDPSNIPSRGFSPSAGVKPIVSQMPNSFIYVEVRQAADWYVSAQDNNKRPAGSRPTRSNYPWGTETYLCIFSDDSTSDVPTWRRRSEVPWGMRDRPSTPSSGTGKYFTNPFANTTGYPQIYDKTTTNPSWLETHPQYTFGTALTPINLPIPPLGYASTTFVPAVSLVQTNDLDSDNFYAYCQIPVSNYHTSGYLGIMLDPHIDLSLTQLIPPNSVSGYDLSTLERTRARPQSNQFIFPANSSTSWWHYTPFISGLSRDWAAPSDLLESLTVYGGDFCSYSRVYCLFANSETGFSESAQGDILSDTMALCQLPPYETPQPVTLTLTFCKGGSFWDQDKETCSCTASSCGSANTASIGFDFSGIESFAPSTGPVQGNTNVTFSGTGFTYYFEIKCLFPHHTPMEQTALVVNDTTIVCITPPAPLSSALYAAGTVELHVQGYFAQSLSSPGTPFLYVHDLGSTSFTYGFPSVTQISPSALEFSSDPYSPITISGQYFNGGDDSDDAYYLVWQIGSNPASDHANVPPINFINFIESPCSKSFVPATATSTYTFDLICDLPNFATAQVYPLRVIFSSLPTILDTSYPILPLQLGSLEIFTGSEAQLKAVDWCFPASNCQPSFKEKLRNLPFQAFVHPEGGDIAVRPNDGAQVIGFMSASNTAGPTSSDKVPGSIVCRFEPIYPALDDAILYAFGNYNGTDIICTAPARDTFILALMQTCDALVSDGSDSNTRCPNYLDTAFSVSLDCGVTWSPAEALPVSYNSVSSLTASFILVLIPMLAYFF